MEKGFGFIMREREGGKFEMAGKVREGVISGDRFTTIEGRRTRNRRNGRRRRRRRRRRLCIWAIEFCVL